MLAFFDSRFAGELLPEPRRRRWRWLRGRRRWRLLRPLRYTDSRGIYWEVPAGAVVDFASVPRLCYRAIGPPVGPYAEAAVLHDWLWVREVARLRRGEPADFSVPNWVFFDAMRALGVARWRRWAMWAAVAANGQLVLWAWRLRRAVTRVGSQE